MFDFLKKKQTISSSEPLASGEPIISALLLEGETFPVEAFLKQAGQSRLAGQVVSNIEGSGDGVFSFDLGDEFFALAVMPAPYPASDLKGPIATTWLWPPQPPVEALTRHRTHLLVTMTGGRSDPVRRRLMLTAVTKLAAQQPGVLAVYWPEATLIIFPPVFISMAEQIHSPETPPLYLWVDLRARRNPDGSTGLFTVGLNALGHMEIEIPRIEMDAGELREWLLNIMYYLLDKGPVLEDGQTIGMSAEQQFRIRHVPSSFGQVGKVVRLDT